MSDESGSQVFPTPASQLAPLSAELGSAELGDRRLTRRLGMVVDAMSERPDESFPNALGDGAALEGAYRFFSNDKVTAQAILEPHASETAARAAGKPHVLVVHDSSEFEFAGEMHREGLGRLLRPGQGFFGHFALGVSLTREPLGVLGFEAIVRTGPSKRKARKAAKSSPKKEKKKSPPYDKFESRKWLRLVNEAERRLDGARAIHVMDREADACWLLDALLSDSRSFVIRSNHDRVLDESTRCKLRDTAREATSVFEREVPLGHRKASPGPKGKRHPPRQARIATLRFAALSVVLPSTLPRSERHHDALPLNVVHVLETEPPHAEEPVEWFLLTNLPIDTAAETAFIVDAYRARWTIEEYFKALKTGCRIEKRQLESLHGLLNALAVFIPIAWRLLLLRHLAREAPSSPATAVLTPTQIEVLSAVGKRALPAQPSVRDALLAVAAFGGHLKRNGEPGWIVLGRGYQRLLSVELGWRAAREM